MEPWVFYTAVFTVLVCLIEVRSEAKTSFRAIFSVPLLLYTLIYLVGNIFGALAAGLVQEAQLPALTGGWVQFVQAFAGVFAFQGVIGHTNVTVFGQGVLTIEDWIAKGRDSAVTSAADRELALAERRAMKFGHVLAKLPSEKLNAYLAQYLGTEMIKELDAQLPPNTDAALYKAHALAYDNPSRAKELATLVTKGGK